MGLFDNLNFDKSVVEDTTDSLGGFAKIDETGLYDFIVDKAFMGASESGALFYEVHLKAENGAIIRQRDYISNKAGDTFYVDKKSGEKRPLPGYSKMRALNQLLTGKDEPYPKLAVKTIKLYNHEAKGEVPVEREVPVEWFRKPISALIMKKLENKNEQGDGGQWIPTAETKETIEVEHYLHPVTHATRNELIGSIEPEFAKKWTAKYGRDFVMDKRTIKTDSQASGSTESAPVNNAEVDDLFS